MQMPGHNPLLQTEPKVLREPLQLLQVPLHLPHQIRILWPQVVLHVIPEYRGHPHARVHRLLVRETHLLLQEPHLHAQLLHARVQQVRVPVRGPVQAVYAHAPEELERRPEAEVGVWEEEPRAAEDEAAWLVGGGEEVAGEELEDGGDVGGVDGGGEEGGAVVGEAGDVGVGEGVGFEEGEGGEDVVDGVGEREVVGFGIGVDYG